MALTRYQTRLKLQEFNSRPFNYSQDEARELKAYADRYSLSYNTEIFNRIEENGGIARPSVPKESGLLSQFSSGFTEGALGPVAFGGWSEDPQDEAQSLAHSMGHLLGFALPMAGALVTGGGTLLARTALPGISNVGRLAQGAGAVLRQQKSIPLRFADKVEEVFKHKMSKSGWAVATHLNKGTPKGRALDILIQSQHLGIASAFSGLFNGEDDELDAYMFGSIAGGAFGGLGNFVNTGTMLHHTNRAVREAGRKSLFRGAYEWSKLNKETLQKQIGSGIAGSIFQGGMATMQGAPTATQIYEYMLGGFFGQGAKGVYHKQANEFMRSWSAKDESGAFKYSKAEQRNMIDERPKSRFMTELDNPISKQIVKESFTRHIGEMYDDTISLAGTEFASLYKDELPSALRRVAKKFNKEVKNLEPHEIAYAKGELMDKVNMQQRKKLAIDFISDQLRKDLVSGKELSEQSKEVIEHVSKADIELAKSGVVGPLEKAIADYYDRQGHKKVLTTAQDIIKSADKEPSQKESQVSPLLKNFINDIQDQVNKGELGYKAEEVLTHVIEEFNTVRPGLRDVKENIRLMNTKEGVKTFVESIKKKFPALTITGDMESGLHQLFQQLTQNEIRPLFSYNTSTQESSLITGFNSLMKRITGFAPRTPDEKINRKKGYWSDRIQVDSFDEVVKKIEGDNHFSTFKAYDSYWFNRGDKFEYVPVMESGDWVNVMKHLHTKGFYLKIPNKDKGKERIYKLHPETRNTKVNDMIKERVRWWNKRNPDDKVTVKYVQGLYDKGFRVWLDTMGIEDYSPNKTEYANLKGYYRDSLMSNYLYEKNWGFKDSAGRVKRESLLGSDFYEQNKDLFKTVLPDGKVEFVFFEAEKNLIKDTKNKVKKWLNVDKKEPEVYLTKDRNGNIVEKAWESKIDGWMVMHSDLFKAFVKANFSGKNQVSHLKPVVAFETPDGQLFMVKGGVHPSRAGYDFSLKPNQILISTSAVKAMPENAVVHKLRAKGSKKDGIESMMVSDLGNQGGLKSSLSMPIQDFRITFGVYGDKHGATPVTIKKQMHSMFDRTVMSRKGYNSFMDAIHRTVMNGIPENNLYLDEIFKGNVSARPKNFDIAQIRDSDYTKIINNPKKYPELYKELMFDVFKKTKRMSVEEEFSDELDIAGLKEFANSFENLFVRTKGNPLSAIIDHKLYNKVVHLYRLRKFTHPEWETSGSGWVAGVDPIMELQTGGIKPNQKYSFINEAGKLVKDKVGHFMLGDSHKGTKVDFNGKRTTLEKAYNEYIKEEKLLKSKKGSATEESVANLRQQLMFAVMRVPASAISGTRGLLFDGFVNNDAGMFDYGVYMRGRDHFYIDGADVDGDKVFFYQGLPKEYMRDIVKNDNQFDKKGVFAENKAERLDKVFGSDLPDKATVDYVKRNPLAPFDPGALRKAGMSSYRGKQGLGLVVNAKSILSSIISDVIYNHSGKLNIEVINPYNGRAEGKLTGVITKAHLNSENGYYVMATEAHSRTADSANYWSLKSPEAMVDIVFKSAFVPGTLKYIPYNKKAQPKEPSFKMLKQADRYKGLIEVNQKLFGRNTETGEKWSLGDVQKTLEKYSHNPEYMSSLMTIAQKMGQNEIHTHPVRGFNYNALNKALAWVRKNLTNSRDLLEHIARKSLFVKPKRFSIDRKGVIKEFSKFKGFRTAPSKRYPEGRELKTYESIEELIWEGIQPMDVETGMTPLEKRVGKDAQKAFNKIYSNKRESEGLGPGKKIYRLEAEQERDFLINDIYDIHSAIQLDGAGSRLKRAMGVAGLNISEKGKRSNVPQKMINEIAGKLLNDPDAKNKFTTEEKEIYARWSKEIQASYDAMREGKIPEGFPENDFINFRNHISALAESIKIRFRYDYNKKSSDKTVAESLKEVDANINENIQSITKRAKAMKVAPEVALDYYFNHLLSSLSPQKYKKQTVKRNITRLFKEAQKSNNPYEVQYWSSQLKNFEKYYNASAMPRFMWTSKAIPDKVLNDYLSNFANTFDLMNTTRPEVIKEAGPEFFVRDKAEIKTGEAKNKVEAILEKEGEIDRLLDLKENDLGELTFEAPGKIDKRTKAYKQRKSKIPEDIRNEILPSIRRSLRQLGDGAILRMEDMYHQMKIEQGFKGTTSIRLAEWSDLRNFDRYLKEITGGTAPRGRLKKLYSYLFPQTVGSRMAGQDYDLMYRMQVPYKNLDGKAGLTHIKVPISTMGYLQKSGNALRQVEDSIKNFMTENLFSSMNIKAQVESLPDGKNIFYDLFELAIKKQNVDRASKSGETQYYKNEWTKSITTWNKYKDQTFYVTKDGKRIPLLGREIVDTIQEQMGNYFKYMYEGWIGAGVMNKGVWEPIDWKRIDSHGEYKKKGLTFHKLVRFNQYGRMDINRLMEEIIREASKEGSVKFRNILGRTDSPVGVELINRLQYEIALEEHISNLKNAKGERLNIKPDSMEAMEIRDRWRKEFIKKDTPNPTRFSKVGRVGQVDPEGKFYTEYWPQMNHDVKRLNSWVKLQQKNLRRSLNNYFNELLQEGRVIPIDGYKIKARYIPTDSVINQVLGNNVAKGKKPTMTKKRAIDEIMIKQKQDLEGLTRSRIDENVSSEWAITWLNAKFQESMKDWGNLKFGSRPGTGSARGEEPMPYFSYNFDVMETYTNQWVSSFFRNTQSIIAREAINRYENINDKIDPEVKKPWVTHMRKYVAGLMNRPNVLPSSEVGLTKYQVVQYNQYIAKHKKSDDKEVKDNIRKFKVALRDDFEIKKKYGWTKNFEHKISDQNIVDWLEMKSMRLDKWKIPGMGKVLRMGTVEKPKLFGIELPTTEKARRDYLFQIVNNISRFEARWSLMSLLAHPKTALGNILGGSQNTITNSGMRNLTRAYDTKWLLTNVFAGARLKDGTPITDRVTIDRWINEKGALESFYVNEAMLDKSFDTSKTFDFLGEAFRKINKDPYLRDKSLREIEKKHGVFGSIVETGGYFMRTSERHLRSRAFLAHYLHARENLGMIIPDLAFDNPYLIKMALKGVESSQFLYHNVSRPLFASSSMGKVLTRFQPFAWNSIRFRRKTYQLAKRYGYKDQRSMDRLQRMLTQDLLLMGLSNIFVSSLFDSILPPPLSYLQDTADWLYGDERERERAFFSAYPHPALAPLQVITAPIHRVYLPAITAMINDDWSKYTDYYLWTLAPFGRVAKSVAMTYERPEMFPEFMFGIPIHALGKKIREE